MASARQIREALLNLMAAKKTNEMTSSAAQRGPDPSRPIGPENTQEFLDFENRMGAGMVHGARQQAREVQGFDPLAFRQQQAEEFGRRIGVDHSGQGIRGELSEPGSLSLSQRNRGPDASPDAEAAAIRRQQEMEDPYPQPDNDPVSIRMNTLSNAIEDQAAKGGTESVDPKLIRELSEIEPSAARELMQNLRNQEFNPMLDIDDIPF